MYCVKEMRINVRTTPQIKHDLEIAAELKGLTVSALVNSAVVKVIREEKERDPAAFRKGQPVAPTGSSTKHKKPLKIKGEHRNERSG